MEAIAANALCSYNAQLKTHEEQLKALKSVDNKIDINIVNRAGELPPGVRALLYRFRRRCQARYFPKLR